MFKLRAINRSRKKAKTDLTQQRDKRLTQQRVVVEQRVTIFYQRIHQKYIYFLVVPSQRNARAG